MQVGQRTTGVEENETFLDPKIGIGVSLAT